jgi:hypothetical protein
LEDMVLIGIIWKSNSIDCIASLSTHGGRYGEGGRLLGMLSMMDLNLGLHHVQQITSQKSYKNKNGRILQNAILNCRM